MGLFGNIIAGTLYLIVLPLDVLVLFVGIRVLVRRWPRRWLIAWDRIGTPLVELYLEQVGPVAHKLGADRLSEKGQMMLSFGILLALRLVLAGILRLLVSL